MASIRRRLMMESRGNPYEKLDYLTIHGLPLEDADYYVKIKGLYYIDSFEDESSELLPIQYRYKGAASWQTVYDEVLVDLSIGDIELRANWVESGLLHSFNGYLMWDEVFSETLNCNTELSGTPMSLLYNEPVAEFQNEYDYIGQLFVNLNIEKIKNPKTFLPATISLTPFLTGTYEYLFNECKYLENAPDINLINATSNCCHAMFSYCTSLKSIPSINVKEAEGDAFSRMFEGCNGLVDCSISKIQIETEGYNSLYRTFRNCVNMVSAPVLNLPNGAGINEMFSGCSNLQYVKILFDPSLLGGNGISSTGWMRGVSSTGTFVVPIGSTIPSTRNENTIPEGWTIVYE